MKIRTVKTSFTYHLCARSIAIHSGIMPLGEWTVCR